MPHSRSAEKARERRDRAVYKGFLVWKPAGSTHVLVPSSLATRVRTVARSLGTHKSHCELLGRSVHFAATAAAQAPISVAERQHAFRLHRAANRAKHVWADVIDDEDSAMAFSGAPPRGGADEDLVVGHAHVGVNDNFKRRWSESPPCGGGAFPSDCAATCGVSDAGAFATPFSTHLVNGIVCRPD